MGGGNCEFNVMYWPNITSSLVYNYDYPTENNMPCVSSNHSFDIHESNSALLDTVNMSSSCYVPSSCPVEGNFHCSNALSWSSS